MVNQRWAKTGVPGENHLTYQCRTGPFKNISLISSQWLIRGGQKPGYPEKNHLTYQCRTGPFKNISLISSQWLIRGGQKPGYPEKNHLTYQCRTGPFKNISLISSQWLIRGGQKPGYPEKNHLTYQCRTWHLTCAPSKDMETATKGSMSEDRNICSFIIKKHKQNDSQIRNCSRCSF